MVINDSKSTFFIFSFLILFLFNPLVFSVTEIQFANLPTFGYYPSEINVFMGVNQSLEKQIDIWSFLILDSVNVTYVPSKQLNTTTLIDIYGVKKDYDFFTIPTNYPNTNRTYFNITISPDTPTGDYSGSIFIQSDTTKSKQRIPVNIHVNNSNPIDLFTVPVIMNPIIYPDYEDIEVHMSIHKSIFPQAEAKIKIVYCAVKVVSEVCNVSKPMYYTETMYIKNWLDFTRYFNTTGISLDTYILKVELYYANDPTPKTNSNTFIVTEVPSVTPPPTGNSGNSDGTSSTPSINFPTEPSTAEEPIILPLEKYSVDLSVPLVIASSREQTKSFIVELENNGDSIVKSGHISIYGIPDGWISIEPAYQNIPVGGKVQYNISLTIPLFADIDSELFMSILFYDDNTFKISKSSKVILSDTLSDVAKRLMVEARDYNRLFSETLSEFKDINIHIEPDCENQSCAAALNLSAILLESNKTADSIKQTNKILESYNLAFKKINKLFETKYTEKRQYILNKLSTFNKNMDPETKDVISTKLEESKLSFYEDDNLAAYKKLQEIDIILDAFNSSEHWKKWTYLALLSALMLIIAVVVLYITEEHKIRELTQHTVKRHLHRIHTSFVQKKETYIHKSQKNKQVPLNKTMPDDGLLSAKLHEIKAKFNEPIEPKTKVTYNYKKDKK